jgi:hypothetical protein
MARQELGRRYRDRRGAMWAGAAGSAVDPGRTGYPTTTISNGSRRQRQRPKAVVRSSGTMDLIPSHSAAHGRGRWGIETDLVERESGSSPMEKSFSVVEKSSGFPVDQVSDGARSRASALVATACSGGGVRSGGGEVRVRIVRCDDRFSDTKADRVF